MYKVLIIDDEKDNTEIIKDILEDVNYSTVLARSATEAKTIDNTHKNKTFGHKPEKYAAKKCSKFD